MTKLTRSFPLFVLILMLLGPSNGLAKAGIAPTKVREAQPAPQPSASEPGVIYLPLAFRQYVVAPPPPPLGRATRLFCSSEDSTIPDDDPSGTVNTITIEDPRVILDLDVRLEIYHTWVGDLTVSLAHQESGKSIVLVDRPGHPQEEDGCREDNIGAILNDEITGSVESKCSATAAGISGIYRPEQPLDVFDGESIAGNWSLVVSDHDPFEEGQVTEWCIAADINDEFISPPVDPPLEGLPDQAQIQGVTGRSQALPLDCETRSAVDWAAYFGVHIDEFDFFNHLPLSDNPDAGFVGDVWGTWGQIPPNDYGVHAEPVAALLRDYGLPANAHSPLSWDGLRAEIAAGRPVIAWITGGKTDRYVYVVNEIPHYYLSGDGHLSTVARYEHTIVITGYTQDTISFLNGGSIYTRNINQFLDSWSVLGNMAITFAP